MFFLYHFFFSFSTISVCWLGSGMVTESMYVFHSALMSQLNEWYLSMMGLGRIRRR